MITCSLLQTFSPYSDPFKAPLLGHSHLPDSSTSVGRIILSHQLFLLLFACLLLYFRPQSHLQLDATSSRRPSLKLKAFWGCLSSWFQLLSTLALPSSNVCQSSPKLNQNLPENQHCLSHPGFLIPIIVVDPQENKQNKIQWQVKKLYFIVVLFMCVYECMCIYSCMLDICECTYVWMQVYVKMSQARRQFSLVSSSGMLSTFFERESLIGLEHNLQNGPNKQTPKNFFMLTVPLS